MSKKLLCILGILLTIVIGTILYALVPCNCGSKTGDKALADADKPVAALPGEKTAEAIPAVPDSVAIKNRQAVREKINADPIVLYFGSNRSDFTPDNVEKQKMDELLSYLNNNPDAGVLVTGHADITGNRPDNIALAQKRADFVKAYLVQNGFTGGRISAVSKGPDEPAADNNTPEGRAKNRRAVVTIK